MINIDGKVYYECNFSRFVAYLSERSVVRSDGRLFVLLEVEKQWMNINVDVEENTLIG